MEPTPAGFEPALRGLIDRECLASRNWQEQQFRANRRGAHPAIIEWERMVLARCKKLGVPMYAHSMVRSHAEQAALFVKGVTRDSPADGYWPHKAGAVDLVHSRRHWDLTEEQWLLIGHIGKQCVPTVPVLVGVDAHGDPIVQSRRFKIEWGGDWKKPGQRLGWDPAHWQLTRWREAADGYPWN